MKGLFVHMALLVTAQFAVAQSLDSTQILREAEVRDMRKAPLDYGKTIQHLPINSLQTNLGTLLQGSSQVLIKSYGPGMLGSLSIRGTGAAHSPILWNGLNIQNNMSSQQDLSLIQGFLFDAIQLNAGAQNNLSTGGILGGSIALGQQKIFQPLQIDLGMDFGSFGTQRYRLGIDSKKGAWTNRFRTIYQEAQNNITFNNRTVLADSLQTLQHAHTALFAAINETRYLSKSGWEAGFSAWYQRSERQIPETMLQSSIATQQDEAFRFNGFWEKGDSNSYLRFTSGLFAENLWYHDPEKKLEGLNNGITWVNQGEYRKKLEHFSVQAGVNYQIDQANSNSFKNGGVQIHSGAIYGAAYGNTGKHKRISWKADIRQAMRGTLIPKPAFSLGADYLLSSKSTFRAHLSHISRLPNLNDLYWNPGGDPDLQPEKGYSGEFSYLFSHHTKRKAVHVRLTGFYSIIDQWIIWLPDNGFWTPQNLQKVHNRGLEWEGRFIKRIQKSYLTLLYGGTFLLASNEEAKNAQDLSVGKQLIYVPYWKNYASLELRNRRGTLIYRHAFTGGRYTSSDNQSFLAPYSVGDLELNYTFNINRKQRLQAGFSIQNIWNESFESIEWRPMPGRYYQLSINYQFYKK